MLGFNHSLAGSIVAVLVPTPLVPVVSVAAHFVLDLTPHFGRSESVYPYSKPFKIWLATDALLCIVAALLAMALFPDKWFIIGVGAFFGVLPDLFWPLWHRGPAWLDKFLDWAEWIQWGERPYGWLFDAFYGFLFTFTLFALAGKV